MDIAKIIFDTIDKLSDKSYNDNATIEGFERISAVYDECYDENGDLDCLMDLYFDAELTEKLPVVLYIHGGGFVAGGKEYRRALATWYATKGFFVVNVNYGLSPYCVFPQQIKHLTKALNWIEENAERLNLDKNKIIVAGDSAGAYYAAMLACVTEDKNLQKKLGVNTNSHLAGAVLNCGLYDMQSILDKRLAFNLNELIFEQFTGIKKQDVQSYEFKDYCSPLGLVNEKFPATFVIFSKKDIFCAGQAEELIKRFREKNIYYESYHSTSPFLNHCFSLDWKNKATKDVMDKQSEFLEKIKTSKIDHRNEKGNL